MRICCLRRYSSAMNIKDVLFPSSDGTFQLAGSLHTAASSSASVAVVIVGGSGPVDRNGDAKMLFKSMPVKTHKRLAEHLCGNLGISVLSYDKRGCGSSLIKGKKYVFESSGLYDFASDAAAAVRFAKSSLNKNIVLMGHSEGAILIPEVLKQLSQSADNVVIGAVFLAGLGEGVPGAAEKQRETFKTEIAETKGIKGCILRFALPASKIDKSATNLFDQIKANPDKDWLPGALFGLIKTPAKWWREHLAYDFASETRELVQPMSSDLPMHVLAITGAKDVQVQASLLEKANEHVPKASSVTTAVPANMTHVLRALPNGLPITLLGIEKQYAQQAQMPLDPDLITALDSWFTKLYTK